MARQLLSALMRGGYVVDVISELRSFEKNPTRENGQAIQAKAAAERQRIKQLWETEGPPGIWVSYHPYYKAPDLLGPDLAAEYGIPYVTAETSYSARRNVGPFVERQSYVLDGITRAAVNICFTHRDREGILGIAPNARVAMLPPFVDVTPFRAVPPPKPESTRLIAVAMMRAGDKTDSYAQLAEALALLPNDLPWRLSIVGDGPMRIAVEAMFAEFHPDRIEWHGEQTTEQIAKLLSRSAVFVWPGFGEAYGLSYLEAQATGVPAVAHAVAGVPEVVNHGVTGLLTPENNPLVFAVAIEELLTKPAVRARMSSAARAWVSTQRSMKQAAIRLDAILTAHCKPPS